MAASCASVVAERVKPVGPLATTSAMSTSAGNSGEARSTGPSNWRARSM